MRIKFKSPDPRAGTVAQMDSHRGRQLVDAGAADQVKDDEGINGKDPKGTHASADAPARASTARRVPRKSS